MTPGEKSGAGAVPAREVYLDHAAATPVDPEVAAAMLPYLTERFWNPSAPYARAREVRDDVERARGTVARLIGARPDCLTFTAGATEANNLAFAAVEGHVVVDAIEHESVLACAGTHARRTVRVGGGRSRGPIGGGARHPPGDRARLGGARQRRDRVRAARAGDLARRGCRARPPPRGGGDDADLPALGRLAGGRRALRQRGHPGRGPAHALRGQDLRPQAGGRALGLGGRAAAPARLRRRPGGRRPLRHGERGRHRRPRAGRSSSRAHGARRRRAGSRPCGSACARGFSPACRRPWSRGPGTPSGGCRGFCT